MPEGITTGLLQLLESSTQILSDDNAENDAAAINKLAAVTNKLAALSDKKLDAETADTLIADVESIIESLET